MIFGGAVNRVTSHLPLSFSRAQTSRIAKAGGSTRLVAGVAFVAICVGSYSAIDRSHWRRPCTTAPTADEEVVGARLEDRAEYLLQSLELSGEIGSGARADQFAWTGFVRCRNYVNLWRDGIQLVPIWPGDADDCISDSMIRIHIIASSREGGVNEVFPVVIRWRYAYHPDTRAPADAEIESTGSRVDSQILADGKAVLMASLILNGALVLPSDCRAGSGWVQFATIEVFEPILYASVLDAAELAHEHDLPLSQPLLSRDYHLDLRRGTRR